MDTITISGFGYKADVCLRGGGLQGLWLNGHPVTTSYEKFDQRIGAEGDILAPFPGRINKGRYTFDGQGYELAINERSGEHAIHGFVRTLTWNVIARSDSTVTVGVETEPVAGYPFRIRLHVQYALSETGLTVTADAENLSDVTVPFAIGYHSYFVTGDAMVDSCTLKVPFEKVLEFEALIPTGTVLSVADAGVDYRDGRNIGEQVIDNCFVIPYGLTPTVTLSGEVLAIDVWMDAAAYPNCVLFTGDTLVDERKRRALAIEPMSCASDGFNHPEWGLPQLNPGDVWTGSWGVSARVLSETGS